MLKVLVSVRQHWVLLEIAEPWVSTIQYTAKSSWCWPIYTDILVLTQIRTISDDVPADSVSEENRDDDECDDDGG